MNLLICLLICFLVGILIYSLIKSYCSCNVVEGNLVKGSINNPITLSRKSGIDYIENAPNSNMCGGTPDRVDVCSNKITKKGLKNSDCNIWDNMDFPPGCNIKKHGVEWFKHKMKCSGVPNPCSGERKPLPPGKIGKQCTCSNGTAATGNNCPDGGEVCDRCNSGYVLDGKVCVLSGRIIPSGPQDCGDACSTNDDCNTVEDGTCRQCINGFCNPEEPAPTPESCVSGSTWSSTGKAPCKNCTQCSNGVKTACTTTTDTICKAAPSGPGKCPSNMSKVSTTTGTDTMPICPNGEKPCAQYGEKCKFGDMTLNCCHDNITCPTTGDNVNHCPPAPTSFPIVAGYSPFAADILDNLL